MHQCRCTRLTLVDASCTATARTRRTAQEFHKTAEADIKVWRDCVAAHGQKHCVRHYHPQQLIKGMYSEFIQVRPGSGALPTLWLPPV